MGLDMYLSYRRNLDGIPETIQRAMRKQAYTDRYPYLAEHFDKEGKLDTIIDHHRPSHRARRALRRRTHVLAQGQCDSQVLR